MIRAFGIALAVGALLLPRAAPAQEWTVDLYGGRATYQSQGALASLGTTNAVLGLRYDGPDGWLFLSAGGPMTAGDPVWGAVGFGRQILHPTGRFTLGLDFSSSMYTFRDPVTRGIGAGATLEFLPLLRLQRATSTLELRSGWLHYGGTFDGSGFGRSVWDNGARYTYYHPARPLDLSGEARFVLAEDGAYPFLGAAASYVLGRAQLRASLGRWLDASAASAVWSLGGSVRLSDRMDAWVSVDQDALDPLYRNGERRGWNLGLSRRLGSAGLLSAPVAAESPDGRVVIRIPAEESATAPYLAGDFNAWRPMRMSRSGSEWVANVRMAPGVYHYAFRTEAGEWFVPRSVPGRKSDGMGGFVAVLVVH